MTAPNQTDMKSPPPKPFKMLAAAESNARPPPM
jgi:hypothetical protein